MSADDDIASLLPEPPPPRPARREAAIAEAMRRFDGGQGTAPAASARPSQPARSWALGRTQVAALASVALVAVIGVSLAPSMIRERFPAPEASAPPATGGPAAPATPVAAPQKPGEVPRSAPPAVPGPALPGKHIEIASKPLASGEVREEPAPPPPAPLPPPPSPPPPPAPEPAPAVVAANRASEFEAADMAAKSRMTARPPAMAAQREEGREIVVTGTRRSRPAETRRGDWNACTVNDPSRSLAGCKGLINPAAKGDRGAAAAQLAEGLALAWQDDLDGAVAAFDRAVALQPRLAFAYLNRGLAHQRNGDLDAAIADLDRAVRYGPSAARNYFNRGVVLRQRGDTRRAAADEERAVNLDSRYQAVVE